MKASDLESENRFRCQLFHILATWPYVGHSTSVRVCLFEIYKQWDAWQTTYIQHMLGKTHILNIKNPLPIHPSRQSLFHPSWKSLNPLPTPKARLFPETDTQIDFNGTTKMHTWKSSILKKKEIH